MDTKANVLLASWPVNSVYTSIVSTNPSSLFGGTWVAFSEGRVLVGKASSGTFDTVAATGGSETHALIEAELPSHTLTVSHTTVADRLYGGTDANRTRTDITGSASNETTSSTGSGTAHNNLQPYIVVYFFKRTA
jgi:microcystin-dependent protein